MFSWLLTMSAGFRSMLGAVELLSCSLFSAVYGRDFHRGPKLADGTSFFAGEDIWSPQQFGVIGEVRDFSVHDEYASRIRDVDSFSEAQRPE